jgi:hypothetical protein
LLQLEEVVAGEGEVHSRRPLSCAAGVGQRQRTCWSFAKRSSVEPLMHDWEGKAGNQRLTVHRPLSGIRVDGFISD